MAGFSLISNASLPLSGTDTEDVASVATQVDVKTLRKKLEESDLADPLRALADPRTAAKLMAALADAVAYAHAQGVLHRDIKPANVLVDKHGAGWLVDFGLAKQPEADGLTGSGVVVGTVRYMAPEQFAGRFDARSDVHSLGLTLYELLTLRAAYPEFSQASLISRKLAGGPARLRLVAPHVPRDLETIVMKACAADPDDRYQTAAALAADLERFGQDEPIKARQMTPVERLVRWSRRNRGLASLSALALALLLAVIGAFAVGNYRTNRALDEVKNQEQMTKLEGQRAKQEGERAKLEGQRAKANLDVAIDVLDQIMANVSDRGVPRTLRLDVDGEESEISDVTLTSADAELLNSLLQFYDKFAAANGADLQVATAKALSRIGDIESRLGHLDRAAAAFEKSLEKYEQLRTESPDDPKLRLAEAATLNDLGTVQAGSGSVGKAIDSHKFARDLLETDDIDSRPVEERFELARSYMLLGSVGTRAGAREMIAEFIQSGDDFAFPGPPPRHPNSLRHGRHEHGGPPPMGRGDDHRPNDGPGPRIFIKHHEDHPHHRDDHRGPGPGFEGPDHMPGRPPMVADLNRGSRILESLLKNDPQNPEYRLTLARCLLYEREFAQLGPWVTTTTPADGDRAETILRGLVTEEPDSPRYLFELAQALDDRGRFFAELEGPEQEKHLNEAADLAHRLTTAYPRIAGYQSLEARTQHDLAQTLRRHDKNASANSSFDTARQIQKRLAEENPTSTFYQVAWAQMLSEWADWQKRDGDQDGARASVCEAVTVAERSAPAWGQDPMFHKFLEHLRKRAEAFK
jgi:tetratricopeptide (TPR) repeat protein